jgi:hypothetical protein
VAGAGVGAEVAGHDEQLGAQDGPETGHRLDGSGLRVAAERGSDTEMLVDWVRVAKFK